MNFYEENWERLQNARDYKMRWLALYTNLYNYVLPNRSGFNVFFNYRDDGIPLTNQIWDATPVLAAYQRANDLHGLLIPQDRRWGRLQFDPHYTKKELIESENAKQFIEDMNERIMFYINQSNLSRAVGSANLDLVGGTGALWVESRSDLEPLCFTPISAVSLMSEYTSEDTIDNAWYGTKMSGRAITTKWPKYRGQCIDALTGQTEELFMVYYGQLRLSETRYYQYAILEDDPFTPLFEHEHAYPQMIIYRDRVRPGEAEGRGPGIDLLPQIQDLNQIVQDRIKSLDMKARPALFYDSNSYINQYNIKSWAGAMIARTPYARNPVEALQVPDYVSVLKDIQDLRDEVRRGFQVDPLGEIESPVRSATEIATRENRAQRTAMTDMSRLINELPKKIYEVSAMILNERNLLVSSRKGVPGFHPKMLSFKYQSPLFDLQNQEDIQRLQQNLQFKQQYFGEGAALATINFDEVNEWLTEKLNLPPKLFKNKEQMQEFLSEMHQQAQNAALPQPATAAAQAPLPQAQGVMF